MLLDEEINILYKDGKIKKFIDASGNFYYFDNVKPTQENIYEKNMVQGADSVPVGLDKWWDIYNSREFAIRHETGNLNAVPIVSLKDFTNRMNHE